MTLVHMVIFEHPEAFSTPKSRKTLNLLEPTTDALQKCLEYGEICSDLDNIKIIRYKSEKGLLQGWVDLIEEHNPDYITGYNIFGFDFDYMIGRVSELYECRPECKFNMLCDV